jgi:hypothetical protein
MNRQTDKPSKIGWRDKGQLDRQTVTAIEYGNIYRATNGLANRQTDIQTDRKDGKKYKEANEQIDKKTKRQVDSQADGKPTNRRKGKKCRNQKRQVDILTDKRRKEIRIDK